MNKRPDPRVFEYESATAFLRAVFLRRKEERRGFSLRLWAAMLGLKPSDSGNLSRILSGQRDLSQQMARKIADELSLGEFERAYFELLSLGQRKISRDSLEKIKGCLESALRDEVPPPATPSPEPVAGGPAENSEEP